MTAPRSLDVVVDLASEAVARAVAEALGPETATAPERTRVRVEPEGARLRILIEAEDTRGLRAAAHSYLRLVEAAAAVAAVGGRGGESFKRPA